MKDRTQKHNDPVPTVDLIVRKYANDAKEILIERRGKPPFEGQYCLPGGHVDYGETVEDAALRELHEETSLEAILVGILGVYSDPKRDPRGQRISTVFIGNCGDNKNPTAGDDARTAEWMNLDDVLEAKEIAFDHRLILEDYKRIANNAQIPTNTFWSLKH